MNREQFHQQAKLISFLLEIAPSYFNENKAIETNENLQNEFDVNENGVGNIYESHDIKSGKWSAFLSQKSENNNYSSLDRWLLKEDKSVSLRIMNQNGVMTKENLVYLEHPYIVRQFSINMRDQQQNLGNESNDDESTGNIESMLFDISASNIDQIHDIDQVDNDLSNAASDNSYNMCNSCKNTIMEWKFSIVYHEVWMVPVLYFQVHFLDGKRCSRSSVLEALNFHDSDSGGICNVDFVIDTWDFLSEEEHPVTGIPSFFLHPCQTSARLQCMLKSLHDNSSCGQDYNRYILLMWMTMILPAVKCKIAMQNMKFLMNNLPKVSHSDSYECSH